MEMGAVRRVLKKGKRWHLLAGDIKPLKEHPRQARVLSYGEKLRLLKVAASRPEWQTARLAAVLVFNSSMRGCEIRGLRWRDVDLIQRTLTVRHSKTEAGERVIPLNADAWSTSWSYGKGRRRLAEQNQGTTFSQPAKAAGLIPLSLRSHGVQRGDISRGKRDCAGCASTTCVTTPSPSLRSPMPATRPS